MGPGDERVAVVGLVVRGTRFMNERMKDGRDREGFLWSRVESTLRFDDSSTLFLIAS